MERHGLVNIAISDDVIRDVGPAVTTPPGGAATPAEGAPTVDGGAALVFLDFVEHNPFPGAALTNER